MKLRAAARWLKAGCWTACVLQGFSSPRCAGLSRMHGRGMWFDEISAARSSRSIRQRCRRDRPTNRRPPATPPGNALRIDLANGSFLGNKPIHALAQRDEMAYAIDIDDEEAYRKIGAAIWTTASLTVWLRQRCRDREGEGMRPATSAHTLPRSDRSPTLFPAVTSGPRHGAPRKGRADF